MVGFITKGRGSSRKVIPIKKDMVSVTVKRSQYFDHYLDNMSDDQIWAYSLTWLNMDEQMEMIDNWDPDVKQDAVDSLRRLFPEQNIPSVEHLDVVEDRDEIGTTFDMAIENLTEDQFKKYLRSVLDLNFLHYTMNHWDDDVKVDALKDIRKFTGKR